MTGVLEQRCRFCGGAIVGPAGDARLVCYACEDAPRRVALRNAHANRYCAQVHERFAAAARLRGDDEDADARERRAAELRK